MENKLNDKISTKSVYISVSNNNMNFKILDSFLYPLYGMD